MSDNFVTIAQFTDAIQANLAKQLLADYKIQSFLAGENATGLYGTPAISTVQLQVLQSRAEDALEILDSQNKEGE